MNSRLTQAIAKNDTATFIRLVQENEEVLDQKAVNSLNTVLHVASRFGHIELVKEIVKLRPDMVAAENKKLETPLHEAARRGNDKVLMLLLETNPWVATKLNCDNQSTLYMACSSGNLDGVNVLLNQPWLLDLDDGDDVTSLNIAVSKGHTDIVKKILDTCPSYAHKVDQYGGSPLHCSCSRGRLEISTMLLRLDPDLALQFNNNGYTPLHLAAMYGHAAIVREFILISPASFQLLSKQGESVVHVSVRLNKYDVFICLAHVFKDTNLFHQPDQYGNTILHLAVTGGRYHFAEYIIRETSVQINCQNCRGHTALDILDEAVNTLKAQNVRDMLKKAGGKRSSELLASITPTGEGLNIPRPLAPLEEPKNEWPVNNELNNSHPIEQLPTAETETNSRLDSLQHQLGDASEVQDDNTPPANPEALSLHKRESKRHREELMALYKNRRKKQHETYTEALQNARNTITLVAILIATVTFSAGINPPGGVYQEHVTLKGKSILGRTKAFKMFAVCNNVALFSSLCIVIVLVSIIPFKRKPLMLLLVTVHKVMWVAVSFMAAAYVAATWAIMPHGRGMDWTFESLLSICSGTLGSVFIGLGVMLTRHWLRKWKWRKEKQQLGETSKRKEIVDGVEVEDQPQSSNSDVDSSLGLGYFPY